MPKIILQGYILVPDNNLESVTAALDEHIRLTREEPGCLVFEVTRDEKQVNRFNVYEEFVDRDAFEFHQQRVAGSYWGDITRNVTRHYQASGLD